MQTVVSNTSPIIILAKTDSLILLKNVFEKVIIPPSVYNEIITKNDSVSLKFKQCDFISVCEATNYETLNNLYSILDKGEAEAITLAKEHNYILVIDEKKGRNVAQNFNLKIIGFLGVLMLNYQKHFITKVEIESIIECAEKFGYRLSNTLKNNFYNALS